MSDDTKAPERIFITGGAVSGSWNAIKSTLRSPPPETPFVHEQYALSLVAAAYEDAASKACEWVNAFLNNEEWTTCGVSSFLCDSTPADAQAALEARDEQIGRDAYTQGVKEAARLFREHGNTDAIFALIQEDKTDE